MSKKQKKNNKNKSMSSKKKMPKFLSTIQRSSKAVWAIIGVVAVVLGLFFNVFLDFPQLVSNLIGNPTPLPIAKAEIENGEILVVVTKFTGESGEAATTRIFRALSDRAQLAELSDVRIELLLDESPHTRDEAIQLGNLFDATLVIWGTADQYGIEPRYQVVRNESLIPTRPDLGTTISTDLPSFNAYVVNGVPNEFEYLMLFSLGQFYSFGLRFDDAIRAYIEATQIDIGDRAEQLDLKTVYYYLGKTHGYNGDWQTAIDDFSKALSIAPSFADAYNDRGYSFEKIGKQDSAISDYKKALEINPNMSSPHVNLGWIYHHKGDYDGAYEEYSRSIELNPNYDQAYLLRGNILFEKEKYTEAISDYNKAIELNPVFGLTYQNRGATYIQLGDYETAVNDFLVALRLDPKLYNSYARLGETYLYMGEYQKAIENLTVFIDHEHTQDANMYFLRGTAYEQLGKIDEALLDYEMALKLTPDESENKTFLLEHIKEISK
jgi:tetratricopeptide (TPR) repeat protein